MWPWTSLLLGEHSQSRPAWRNLNSLKIFIYVCVCVHLHVCVHMDIYSHVCAGALRGWKRPSDHSELGLQLFVSHTTKVMLSKLWSWWLSHENFWPLSNLSNLKRDYLKGLWRATALKGEIYIFQPFSSPTYFLWHSVFLYLDSLVAKSCSQSSYWQVTTWSYWNSILCVFHFVT